MPQVIAKYPNVTAANVSGDDLIAVLGYGQLQGAVALMEAVGFKEGLALRNDMTAIGVCHDCV